MIELVRGFGSLMRGRWKPAQTALDQAEQLFRNHCTGVTWERDTVHNFVLWALVQMGEIAELKRRWTVLYRESQERGDLYAATMLTAFYMTMIKLAGNEQPESEAELEAVLDRREARRFNLQHSNAFESLIHLYLYRSDFSSAWDRIEPIWPAVCKLDALANPDDADPPARDAGPQRLGDGGEGGRFGCLSPPGE